MKCTLMNGANSRYFLMQNKILIVDNGSRYLAQLEGVCQGNLDKVVSPSEIQVEKAEKYGLIILSGGHVHSVLTSEKYYSKELQLLKRAKVPIIGICLGFQLMAHCYGMPLHKINRQEHTFLEIHPTSVGKDIIGVGPFKVYENHHWVISKTPEEFHVLATSKDGIEVIMHTSLPLLGVQFHPEMDGQEGNGGDIIRQVLSYFDYRER